MAEQLWIEPAGGPAQWRRFNRYRDGRPVRYINNHVDLLSDDAYLGLPPTTALLLHRLWLAFASTRAHLQLGASGVRGRLRFLRSVTAMDVQQSQLDLLVEAGFIRLSVTKPSRKRYGFVTNSDEPSARARGRAGDEVEVKEVEQSFKASTNLEHLPSATEDGVRAFSDNDIPFELPTDVTQAMP